MRFENVSSRTVGYCPWPADRIISELNSGTCPSSFPGDFVFIAEGRDVDDEPFVVLLTSIISAQPYFYLVDGNRFYHGENVIEVVKASGVEWQWNARAVNCLAVLDHLIGNDTLHQQVKRVDPSSLYHFSKGMLSASSDITPFIEENRKNRLSADEAVSAIRSITREMLEGRDAAISLSSGYDSRVLLALAMDFGQSPVVGTMGFDDSTDVIVAKSICRRFGLEHKVIELAEAEYFDSASDILRLTSGTKSMLHWHTYLFANNIGFPVENLHLVGSNGEFVRTYYLDKGVLSLLADLGPDDFVTRKFFHAKYGLQRRLPNHDIDKFLQTENAFTASRVPDLCTDVCSTTRGFLDKLDWFYSFQRVRHFIGNGLALYNSFNQTASPFLDSRFIACGLGLSRSLKLNSCFHRRIIQRCVPELLDFPMDASTISMRDRAKPLYWLQKHSTKGYSPIPGLLKSKKAQEILQESTDLDMFLPKKDRMQLIGDNRSFFLAFLLTMHFFMELLRKEGIV